MTKIDFKMKLPTGPEKLFELATDFENHQKLFPSQLKSLKIVKKSETEIITEEVLVFNTYFKNTEIHQATKHQKEFPKVKSEIIEGPFKGSMIQTIFQKSEDGNGTNISCDIELRLALKYKLRPGTDIRSGAGIHSLTESLVTYLGDKTKR